MWWESDTGTLWIYYNDGTSSQWVVAAGGGAAAPYCGPPQGRLTLQTGTPVMTTTQAAKTTIYYTPYIGNMVPIYDGSNMVATPFTELSAATTDTTKSPAAIGVSKVNDWFVWNDAGTIRVGHGPDWTDDVTRSAGTALVRVNGIWLNNASITNGPAAQRGTYVGTTRSNGSSQLDWIFGALAANGTAGFLGVWNAYNRRPVVSVSKDSTDSWTYATVAWRAANGSSSIRHSFVVGLAEDPIDARYYGMFNATVGTSAGLIGVGFDSTTAFTGTTAYMAVSGIASQVAFCAIYPPIGMHYVSALEYCQAGTVTYYGDLGGAIAWQSGFSFEFMM